MGVKLGLKFFRTEYLEYLDSQRDEKRQEKITP